VELHPLPLALLEHRSDCVELPILRHRFASVTFRSVQISDWQQNNPETITLTALAYEAMLGLFVYNIIIAMPTEDSTLPPALDIRLQSAWTYAAGKLRLQDGKGGTYLTPYRNAQHRGGAFVSTMSIGARGMRALWVERQSGQMVKNVMACNLLQPMLNIGIPGEDDTEQRITRIDGIDGKKVFKLHSYDLRGKVAICYA